MKSFSLNYNDVHTKTKNTCWDGWTLILLKKSPTAYTQKNAMFYKGNWHLVLNRVEPDSRGLWKVRASHVI